jgi:hypothetical protein
MHHAQAHEEPTSSSLAHPPKSETHSDDIDLLEVGSCSFPSEASAQDGIGRVAI